MEGKGKGNAALILALGKPKGRRDEEEDEDEGISKEAKMEMAQSIIDAAKGDDAEALMSALDDYIASY